MTPTVDQLQQARAVLTEQWQRAVHASVLVGEDTLARQHVDILRRALEECDELIRDERWAMELDKQRAIAPVSTKFGSMTHPVQRGAIRRRR